MPSLHKNLKNFSLIELLIVIAIFLIIGSLLQPSFKNITNKAEGTHCLSKLRQITIGAFGFEADNNNLMPMASPAYNEGWSSPSLFTNATALYLGIEPLNNQIEGYNPDLNIDAFKCPSQFEVNKQNRTYAESSILSFDYFNNRRDPSQKTPISKDYILGLSAINGSVSANKISYFYDGLYRFDRYFYRWTSSSFGNGSDPNKPNGHPNTLIHSDGRSVSYLDGHVEIKDRYDSFWDSKNALKLNNRTYLY